MEFYVPGKTRQHRIKYMDLTTKLTVLLEQDNG
jgi:hypothetical protein